VVIVDAGDLPLSVPSFGANHSALFHAHKFSYTVIRLTNPDSSSVSLPSGLGFSGALEFLGMSKNSSTPSPDTASLGGLSSLVMSAGECTDY
jgi:hypothetical protein